MRPQDSRTGLLFVDEPVWTAMEMDAVEDPVGSARGTFLAGRGHGEREGAQVFRCRRCLGMKSHGRQGGSSGAFVNSRRRRGHSEEMGAGGRHANEASGWPLWGQRWEMSLQPNLWGGKGGDMGVERVAADEVTTYDATREKQGQGDLC